MELDNINRFLLTLISRSIKIISFKILFLEVLRLVDSIYKRFICPI